MSVSMASAKLRDVLDYIHGCPETQCPEEFCNWFEEDLGVTSDPKKGDTKLKEK